MRSLFFIILVLSCAGYKIERRGNPLLQYDIGSLAIPQFVNYSNIPGVAELLTKNFTLLFTEYPSLKVYTGESQRADAILVGIVDGPKNRVDTTRVDGTEFVEDGVLQGRQGFEIPYSAIYNLTVRIMIIKDGVAILERKMPFRGNYSITRAQGPVSAVNFTKNQAIIRQSMALTSQNLAESFKNLVLDAF